MDVPLLVVIGLAVLGGLVLFFSGRLRERYGTLKTSERVTRAYEHEAFDPELVYYTSGPDVCPRAVIGIGRRFVLDSGLWKQRDFDPETFRETVRNMQGMALSTMQMLHGFEILDQRGALVGTWFSALNVRTTIQTIQDNRVRIDPPALPDHSEKP
jgi:hypothetical protein